MIPSLNRLHRSVANSSLTVTIQAAGVAVPAASHSVGFTLHRAVHDAGRVLVVVAGIALIALAVLLPLGLLMALVAWVGLVMRRRAARPCSISCDAGVSRGRVWYPWDMAATTEETIALLHQGPASRRSSPTISWRWPR